MSEPKWRHFWPEFEKKAQARLQKGFEEYTDKSFSRNPSDLISEVEEEIYDQILWGFIALTRISRLSVQIQRLESSLGRAEVEKMLNEPDPLKIVDLRTEKVDEDEDEDLCEHGHDPDSDRECLDCAIERADWLMDQMREGGS